MEVSRDGEVVFKEGIKHGGVLSIKELGDQVDTLRQLGTLTYLLAKGTTLSQRQKLLSETDYIIGVSSTTFLDSKGTRQHDESPDYLVTIGNKSFQVTRSRIINKWEGMEEYNLVDSDYSTSITVWDHEGTPPLVQRVSINQLQDTLDAGHENRKTDALLAREWLVKTRQFLLEATTGLE